MSLNKRMKIYEQLVNLNGVAGYEKNVRSFVKAELQKYADDILQDKLGSIFGVLEGDGPTVMIAGHMDEVGAITTSITEQGFIKMHSIGSIQAEVLLSQNMQITTSEGKVIRGIIGSIPPHITKNSPPKKIEFDDLLLDIGADNKEHAITLGVKAGQQVTPVNNYYITEDNKKIVSKAWDDRFGCGMALEIIKEIKTKNIAHPNKLVIGCTVQEEVGLRGAKTSTQMIQPDLFIAIDVSPVGDFLPDSHPKRFGKLGEGFLVRFYDPSCIMNDKLRTYFYNIATKGKIKYQDFLSMGGTDAAIAQYAGCGTLSTTVGLPGRYIHSTAAMVHIDDIEAVKKMIIKIIQDFDKKRFEEIYNG